MNLRTLQRWQKGRRLKDLHRRLVPRDRLTVDAYEQVVTLLGCNPDRVLQDADEGAKLAAVRLDVLGVRRFLDLTHPGHGIDVEGLTVEEAEIVGAAALANFTLASATNLHAPGPTSQPSARGRKSRAPKAPAAR